MEREDRDSAMCELYIVKVRWHFSLHVFSSLRKKALYQFTISGAQFSEVIMEKVLYGIVINVKHPGHS